MNEITVLFYESPNRVKLTVPLITTCNYDYPYYVWNSDRARYEAEEEKRQGYCYTARDRVYGYDIMARRFRGA